MFSPEASSLKFSQQCLCHIPVEFSPRLATKASWFTHPVPSLLMKGKKDVQSRGELAEVFTTIDANVIPICQPSRVANDKRAKTGTKAFHIGLPGSRQ